MAEQLQALQSQVQISKQGGAADLAKKPLDSAPFSDKEIADIKAWYGRKNYSKDFIKSFQRVVGTKDDGAIGKNTINAVRAWQIRENLTPPDGKFGAGCAAHAGLTAKSSSAGAGADSGSAQADEIPAGGGINAAPDFQKQLDYPTTPYVSQYHYNKMKKAMGDTPYSKWNINDSKISSIYQAAVKANPGPTTIRSSGCGVTSFANLKKMSPFEAAELSMQNNYRVYNGGTDPNFFSSNGGTRVDGYSKTNAQYALDSVAKGKYLICSMKGCTWHTSQKGGHFILVYGYDGSHVYVSDPFSRSAAQAKAPKSEFLKTNAFKYGYLF